MDFKLCRLIPREILQAVYSINISHPQEWEDANRAPTADEFLSAYSSGCILVFYCL